MKVLSNTRWTAANNNGDLVSSSRYTRRIAAGCSKKKGEPNVISKLETRNISASRCVLRDKTNSCVANVKSSVYVPIGYQNSENNRLCSVTNRLKVSRKNLPDSFSFNHKETKDTMKKSETSRNEANEDVYEFVLDEGEVNENKLKTKKQSKRKRVQRKIIDSPEEVLPAKKKRKPLQDKISQNLVPESNPKNRLGSKELNLSSGKSFSNVLHTAKMKMKTVHFSNLSGDELIKSSTGVRMKHCTPNSSTKNVGSPETVQVLNTPTKTSGKGDTRNLLSSLHPSPQVKSIRSCTTQINPVCSPSVSECGKLDTRMKENEVSRKLLSFFSPAHIAGNSRNNYSIPVTEKTPAKQLAARSFNAEKENIEISHSENLQPSFSSDTAEQQCDKTQRNLDVSNCFGFDDDADSEDGDFSPAKTFTKSSHKLGKFQCSTPKDVSQKKDASQPFRFPALSIVKKRKFLQTVGNTPAAVTNLSGKTESSGSTLKRKPCIPASSPVKEPITPTIFDIEDEVHESQDDEKCESEHQQLQKKHKDCVAISSPQKKVVQKSYGTPRLGTRLRQPVQELKDSSEDEAEEIVPKKHKRTHRPPKTNEADEWAKCFNSMCETIDSFELVVE
ncbi:uncharacterized protein LOC126471130 [Schistocerca serialis cubense]|uniref:uncharacterized protein LOC126471130 n=1 Tax=Schistocerca serialis cubense TaxID=2023355 RepID=UPI00214E26DF|nr:uncharacterized protein LOC126471130 [Schistocerca serialis cubense]XP_049955186.1 uncharacterized protein LOC126471130 [Schistocerca serialis cubense]